MTTYTNRKKEGKCVKCSILLQESEKIICAVCREKENTKHRETLKNLKQQHKCVKCKIQLSPEYKLTRCPNCNASHNENTRKRTKRLIEEKKCLDCGNFIETENQGQLCYSCGTKQRSKSQEIRNYLINQKLCYGKANTCRKPIENEKQTGGLCKECRNEENKTKEQIRRKEKEQNTANYLYKILYHNHRNEAVVQITEKDIEEALLEIKNNNFECPICNKNDYLCWL